MSPARGDGRGLVRFGLRRVLFCFTILILYGSLYPWEYRTPAAHPLTVFFAPLFAIPTKRQIQDAILNCALYVPLATAAYFTFRRVSGRWAASALATGYGFAVSAFVEWAQQFLRGRDSSVLDLLANSAGSAGAALLAPAAAAALRRRGALRIADPAGAALLALWVAWLLFPFIPAASFVRIGDKLQLFFAASSISPGRVVDFAIGSFAACFLWRRVTNLPAHWIPLGGCVAVILQILLPRPAPGVADCCAMIAGWALFLAYNRVTSTLSPAAAVFTAAIALRALLPGDQTAINRGTFDWVPFRSVLAASWTGGLITIIQKSYLYGSSIWLLSIATLDVAKATAAVAALLFCLEIAQLSIAGRTSEITDPLLAVLAGACLYAVMPTAPIGAARPKRRLR